MARRREAERVRRPWRARRYCLVPALLLCLLAVAPPVLANGGTIQISERRAGPYELTVTTSPSPIRVGVVDVSVLVQRAGTDDLVLEGARVLVTAEPMGREGQARTYEATREQATNKLFYAAENAVELPTEGRWRITVRVLGQAGEGSAAFEVDAEKSGLLDGPLPLLFLGLPALLALAWVVRSGRKDRGAGGQRARGRRRPLSAGRRPDEGKNNRAG